MAKKRKEKENKSDYILRFYTIVSCHRLYPQTVQCNDMQEPMEKTHLATRE
jgi:hypothetical protein